MARVLTPQNEDFPRWYQDIVAKAELAENGPVKGQQVIRPTGFALWERMVAEMDDRIKETGAENASFPLLIPQSYLSKEAQHVEGFAPECWTVTHAGGKELEEPVVVRPTSETVIGESMSRWVKSYRDLPLLLNQWCNVMRYEMRTRLFLRSSEFLWQEGHTAHATFEDAAAYNRRILHEVYQDFMENVVALPVFTGLKTAAERFAGAINTFTCEAMMRDGKALQAGTAHELGQNFAKAFDIQYLGSDGKQHHAWTTSWGVSTRMVGALIMGHGDDSGLRVPPRLAPVQAYVMTVKDGEGVSEAAAKTHAALRAAGVRSKLNDRSDVAFGRRAVDAELKGYPVRLEIGPRDVAEGKAMLVRRIAGTKTQVSLDGVTEAVADALAADQDALYAEALKFREDHTSDVTTLDEAIEASATGFARLPWDACGTEGETRAAASAVTVRCLQRADGSVPDSEDEAGLVALLGRSY
ncbi:proline--tRNA ligase [Stackebrandtia nassauensis]|uniref:Proline--tRNA ligase n=1 Tax=Stackebrandtia nassauensis (strain DSM 44728 / CIP 108903 / NRRL B-16338 / NBRC 102104 / LLR-40K-21) TaxID=446470 RepID=D3Q205_STANL|nr:proline--tRNA ligase [Stackebrandtia nassauensis]ADD41872.1 prolyl-tRNA synthetase [Stackebrandtia nassauensis DSM 44728]